MANQKHLDILKRGVEFWNKWRESPGYLKDTELWLSGADLSGANLRGADLRDASVTRDQLDKARSLKDTIMPDGSKHP